MKKVQHIKQQIMLRIRHFIDILLVNLDKFVSFKISHDQVERHAHIVGDDSMRQTVKIAYQDFSYINRLEFHFL